MAQGLLGEAVDRIGGQPISARMARKAPIRHLDPMLLLITMVLSVFGALMVFSATADKQEALGGDPSFFLKRQVFYIIAGIVVLLIMSLFDYRFVRAMAPVVYALNVLLLILVLTPLGTVRSGRQGWFNLGVIDLDPAEIGKVVVIVAVAALLAEKRGEMGALDLLMTLGVVAFPIALIFLQPDLGTVMVFVALLAGLLLVGGAKIRHFLALVLIGLVGTVAVFQAGLVKEYQITRLTSFLDANPDVRSEGYNLTQSKIAIGSGGFSGKGFRGENTQTTLDFVPEQHTDFIFTAVGEQLGFIGSAALLSLFALLLWRALRIAIMSRDMFGTIIAGGIATMWAFQIFLNVGMTMGIMPITGVPLPFLSFGGSAMLANFAAIGLLLNIHMRRYLRT